MSDQQELLIGEGSVMEIAVWENEEWVTLMRLSPGRAYRARVSTSSYVGSSLNRSKPTTASEEKTSEKETSEDADKDEIDFLETGGCYS